MIQCAQAQDHFEQRRATAVQPFVAALQKPIALCARCCWVAPIWPRTIWRFWHWLSAHSTKRSALNPAYAEAQAFAGFVRDQRGADGGAWLDRAVELDPDLIVARYFRARHRWAQRGSGRRAR